MTNQEQNQTQDLTPRQKAIIQNMHRAGVNTSHIADFVERPINEINQVLGPVLLKE